MESHLRPIPTGPAATSSSPHEPSDPSVDARRNDPSSPIPRPSLDRVARLLTGQSLSRRDLPALAELITALTTLARGSKNKVLVPLGERTAEYALVRHGERVLVSFYETGNTTDVHLLDYPVDLKAAITTCARASMDGVGDGEHAPKLAAHLAERAVRTELCAGMGVQEPIGRRGGFAEPPKRRVPLAFGFDVAIRPGTVQPALGTSPSDVHALLFRGHLWAFVNGKKTALARGPIMVVVQRMIAAVRAVVDAWDLGRAAHVRLHAGSFQIGIRLSRQGHAAITLGQGDKAVTATELEVPQIGLPILRLATDLLRCLVQVDRAQSRNLRVRSLRDEVRSLRRVIRNRDRRDGFVNQDPERLRNSAAVLEDAADLPLVAAPALVSPSASLEFSERWRLEIDGLDAASTFFCGDRLVVATARHTFAIDRGTGDVLWVREGAGMTTMMAGTSLIRIAPDGKVELCDVEAGEPYATTRIVPRLGHAPSGIPAGGGSIPPVAILTEGDGQLVAIDLRHGEPRWRFNPQREGTPAITRAGRVLVVASGDGSIHALDIATGELVWRFTERDRFVVKPAVCRDHVIAVSGEPGGRRGAVFGIDLYSGHRIWSHALASAPTTNPVTSGSVVVVPSGTLRHGNVAAFNPLDGDVRWELPDPGLNAGGSPLTVDRNFIVNAPAGRITAIDIAAGRVGWTHRLSDPLADVPRRLDPVLRGGALFVPASRVHVIRAHDGSPLGEALPCELIPDAIRVDERGWVYIAEESGFLAACAPVPHLRLVK